MISEGRTEREWLVGAGSVSVEFPLVLAREPDLL